MMQLFRSGPTAPSAGSSASLNHNGPVYNPDERKDQGDQRVDEELDALAPLATTNNPPSIAGQNDSSLRNLRGSRTPIMGRMTARVNSDLPPQDAQGLLPSNTPTDTCRRESRRIALDRTLAFAGVGWLLEYTVSIVRSAGRYLRKPRYPLIIFILFLVASLFNQLSSTIPAIFSSLCYQAPSLSFLPACGWVAEPPPSAHGMESNVMWADFPGLVDLQSRTFEQLMDNNGGGTSISLALPIKKSEMAIEGLIGWVRLSGLHSKDSLAESLSEFARNAKIAGRSLHRLSAKMNGAMDDIMAVNDFALRAIDSARANEPKPGVFGALMIWKPNKKAIDEVVEKNFADAMHIMSTRLGQLIVELEATIAHLNKLEENFYIIDRENAEAVQEWLENLLTALDSDFTERELVNFGRNMFLLRDLTQYGKRAVAHVAATLHALQTVSEDMEDMRERVAAPNLAGRKIPPEVHMNSIKNGLDRLRTVGQGPKPEILRGLGIEENGFKLDS